MFVAVGVVLHKPAFVPLYCSFPDAKRLWNPKIADLSKRACGSRSSKLVVSADRHRSYLQSKIRPLRLDGLAAPRLPRKEHCTQSAGHLRPEKKPQQPRRQVAQLLAALAWGAFASRLSASSNTGIGSSSTPSSRESSRMIPKYKLNDGTEMPALGLGTYRVAPGQQTYEVVKTALKLGYRMIDTAEAYGNEADVGRACRDSGLPRESLYITSKLLDIDHRYRQALRAGRNSAEQLGLGYIDLFLIHSPGVFSPLGGNIVETYDALLQLQREGVVRSVGVSNFGLPHLEALQASSRPMPAVNQFELHPLVFSERSVVVEYCRRRNILVQAYGSVLSGRHELIPQIVTSVATAHAKSTAQIMLRWALDQGFQVIPKSVRPDRLAENMDIFDFTLTSSEIQGLNNAALGRLPGEYWGGVDPFALPVSLGEVGTKSENSMQFADGVQNAFFDAFSDSCHAVVSMATRNSSIIA